MIKTKINGVTVLADAAKIILDESKYGVTKHNAYRWSFYATKNKSKAKKIRDEDSSSFITVGYSKEPILIAVNKSQYKSWSKQDIIAIKRSIISFWIDTIKRIFK